MGISQRGLDLIKAFEGFKENAYLCPSGIPTIGYGSTTVNGIKVKLGDKITKEAAEKQLFSDTKAFEAMVVSVVGVPMTQGMLDALISITYNVGPGRTGKKDGIIRLKSGLESTLIRKVNLNDKVGAAHEFLKWSRSGGVVLNGLKRRRQAEKDLFLS